MKKNIIRIVSFIMVITLLSTYLVLNPTVLSRDTKGQNFKDEERIINQIINVTGASREQIEQLRADQVSFQEILDKVGGNNATRTLDDIQQILTEDGYSETDIDKASSYISQIEHQLSFIVMMNKNNNDLTQIENEKDDYFETVFEAYSKEALLEAVVLFQNDIGSQKIVNDYIASIQCDVSFGLYILDRELFEDSLMEKQALSPNIEYITVDMIMKKYLEVMNGDLGEALNTNKKNDSYGNNSINDESLADNAMMTFEGINTLIINAPDPKGELNKLMEVEGK